jgi:hypothetical protein
MDNPIFDDLSEYELKISRSQSQFSCVGGLGFRECVANGKAFYHAFTREVVRLLLGDNSRSSRGCRR